MIQAISLTDDNRLHLDLDSMDIAFARHQTSGWLWVDLEGEAPESVRPLLEDTFGFHPLAVSNALKASALPRMEEWGGYLHLVIHEIELDSSHPYRLSSAELDAFLGKNFIVTYHSRPLPALKRVWESAGSDPAYLRQGVGRILYRIAEEITLDMQNVSDHIDQRIDRIEMEIFRRARKETPERIFSVKRSLIRLRRIIGPQSEVFGRLARQEFAVIDQKDRIYFQDVADHLTRLEDAMDGMRDLLGGSIDTYLSVSNHRLSDVIRTLTVITTIFMPLTFITSFFGMNFFLPEHPVRELMGRPVLWVVLILLVVVPAGMLTWMRSRGWIRTDSAS